MKTISIVQVKEGSPLWKMAKYLLFAFFAVFPFVVFGGFLYGGSSSRSVELVTVSIILGIISAILLFRKSTSVSIPKSWIVLTVSLYFLSMLISGISSIDPHLSFWSIATRTEGIWYFAHLALFATVLFGVIWQKRVHRGLILVIAVSTAVYSLFSLLSAEGVGLLFRDRLGDGFTMGNSTFAGMYILGAFILSLYYVFQAESRKWWMYALPFVIVLNPFIVNKGIFFGDISHGVIGEARMSSYALILSILGVCALWVILRIKNDRKRSIALHSALALLLLGAALSAWSLFAHDGYVRKAYLARATAARPVMWEMSEKAILQRPVLGWGIDTFERVFESNYDNRLLQNEYGAEAWFDRAHNVFIDQLVDNGSVGLVLYLAIYIAIALSLAQVALKSSDKDDRAFAGLLIVYFVLHFMELQTSFDTSVSYPLLIFMAVSAAVLVVRMKTADGRMSAYALNTYWKYTCGALVGAFSLWSLFCGLIPFVSAQLANGSMRSAGDTDKRMALYPRIFGSPVDEHSFLWRTSTDFQRALAQNPAVTKDPMTVVGLKKEMSFFEQEYVEYLKKNPRSFRARLNLADVMMYQKLFGVDRIDEAQRVLDQAIELVPQAPQPYWMKSVAYVYSGKFDLARAYAMKAYDLNREIEQSKIVVDYVEASARSFPKVGMFHFKQL